MLPDPPQPGPQPAGAGSGAAAPVRPYGAPRCLVVGIPGPAPRRQLKPDLGPGGRLGLTNRHRHRHDYNVDEMG